MKKIIRRIGYLLCAMSLVVAVAACAPTEKVVPKEDEKETVEAYSEELAKYFPTVEGTVLNYSGSYEYDHVLNLSKVTESEDLLRLDFKGEIEDLSDGEGKSKEERLFETEYIITKDSVKEVQKNIDRRHSQSIIREQVVLKLPLEVNSTWKQMVNIEGKEYEAETKILDITKDDKGKEIVRTEMIVKGIEYYPDNTYREVRSFKEDKGLSEFSTMILLKGQDPEDINPLEFGYYLYERE